MGYDGPQGWYAYECTLMYLIILTGVSNEHVTCNSSVLFFLFLTAGSNLITCVFSRPFPFTDQVLIIKPGKMQNEEICRLDGEKE